MLKNYNCLKCGKSVVGKQHLTYYSDSVKMGYIHTKCKDSYRRK